MLVPLCPLHGFVGVLLVRWSTEAAAAAEDAPAGSSRRCPIACASWWTRAAEECSSRTTRSRRREANASGDVEVTTTVSPTTAEFVARRVRNPLRDARLRMAWFLVMRNDNVDFRAIGSPIADLLVAMEALGEYPWHFRAVMPA